MKNKNLLVKQWICNSYNACGHLHFKKNGKRYGYELPLRMNLIITASICLVIIIFVSIIWGSIKMGG